MYKDINPAITVHPDTHDITIRTGVSAINGSISNLILSTTYNRPYNKLLAGNMFALLFEQAAEQNTGPIKTTIEQLISNFEPRAENVAVDVSVAQSQDGYVATIVYNEVSSGKRSTVTVELNQQ